MTMDADDLERHVHRSLASLPAPRAPATLRPRVLAAVAPDVVGRPWFTWPWPLQVAALLTAIGCAGLLAWAWPTVVAVLASAMPERLHAGAGHMASVAETGTSVVRLLQLTWTGVVAPMAKLALLLTVMLGTACAVCLAAFSRVALGGASQS